MFNYINLLSFRRFYKFVFINYFMKEYIERYNDIVNELVKKSFSKLKDKKIKIFEFGFINLYGLFLPFNFIGMNKKCRGFSEEEIRGILAHELCHAEFGAKKGILWLMVFFVFYWFFSKLRIDEEIRNDREVVKKGYAKELFKITKRIEKEYNLDNIKYGLSSKEIKSYARKIKKW